MKATPAQKIKMGIFTLAGIGLFVAGVFMIGSRRNMFADTFSIYGLFRNVGGLQVGNNVRFAGINVGTVDGINMVNDSTVRVDMILQSRVKPFLKNDATAAIGSDGLMGDKLVAISAGPGGDRLLGAGQQIRTANPSDFNQIIDRIAHVAENAEAITGSLADIGRQISAGKGSIGRLIYSDTLERGLVGTINTAQETIRSAKKGTEGFSENMEALKHNFLLKGYFKKKAKSDAEKKANGDEPLTKKQQRREAREERRERKREAKEQDNAQQQ